MGTLHFRLVLSAMTALALLAGCAGPRGKTPAVTIRNGDDYDEARLKLEQAGAEDWSSICGYIRLSWEDVAVTASYWTLPDGHNFTLGGASPLSAASDSKARWTVDTMHVSDSRALRDGKRESDFGVARVSIRDGQSRFDALPESCLHLWLPYASALRRMEPYGWQQISFEPFEGTIDNGRQAKRQHIAPEDGWSCHQEADGSQLYLRNDGTRDAQLVEILLRPAQAPESAGGGFAARYRADGLIPFEIFDQHELTASRCRAVLAGLLPAGWKLAPVWWRDNRYTITASRESLTLTVRVLRPVSAARLARMQKEKPRLQAHLAELNRTIEAAKGNSETWPDEEQFANEGYAIQAELEEMADLSTSLAAYSVNASATPEAQAVASAFREAVRQRMR